MRPSTFTETGRVRGGNVAALRPPSETGLTEAADDVRKFEEVRGRDPA
jgi:hypothetical protein